MSSLSLRFAWALKRGKNEENRLKTRSRVIARLHTSLHYKTWCGKDLKHSSKSREIQIPFLKPSQAPTFLEYTVCLENDFLNLSAFPGPHSQLMPLILHSKKVTWFLLAIGFKPSTHYLSFKHFYWLFQESRS